MDILLLALLLSIGIFVLNGKQQRQRIGLLASHLAQYQIEKLLENLIEGYMRALGETDPARRQQIWDLLRTTELQLSEQFRPTGDRNGARGRCPHPREHPAAGPAVCRPVVAQRQLRPSPGIQDPRRRH
jgi:hypothetical protein